MNDENQKVKDAWEKEWRENETLEDTASPIGKWLRRQRLEITQHLLKLIQRQEGNKDLKVIDLGCGGGTTLTLIRESGLWNSIGIDYSQHALNNCIQKGFTIGSDVYLMDAKKTIYPEDHFDLVFSEGLWEHFKNPEPYIDEACRIAGKYIMIIQPDHYTLFGGLLHWAWKVFNGGGVWEYSFPMSYFIDKLDERGYNLYMKKTTLLKEQAVMLFKKR